MKPRSLATRIVASVVGVDLLLTTLLLAFGVFIARTELSSAFDVSLRSKALSVRALVRYAENNTPELLFDSSGVPASVDASHPDLFNVFDAKGKLIAQSSGWSGLPTNAKYWGNEFAKFWKDGVPFRAIVVRNVPILDKEDEMAGPPARISVVYASSLLDVRSRVFHFGLILGIGGATLLIVIAGLTVWIIRRSLIPLHDLAGRAGQISVRQWSFDPPPGAKVTPELAPLTNALETLVSRLHDSFAHQRQFTSDLAHELKTSVAIIKSSIQVLLQSPRTADQYRGEIEALLGDTERLESLVERMLRLARAEQWSEAGSRKRHLTADLVATCESAISRTSAIATSKNIQVHLEGTPALQVSADPEDLELVWVNLLDNAVRHSGNGSVVYLRVNRADSGSAIVTVEDNGDGISQNDLPRVFERFHRGDKARGRATGGFGLGLAICKAIVEAYGGGISIESKSGEGTTVQVILPTINSAILG